LKSENKQKHRNCHDGLHRRLTTN